MSDSTKMARPWARIRWLFLSLMVVILLGTAATGLLWLQPRGDVAAALVVSLTCILIAMVAGAIVRGLLQETSVSPRKSAPFESGPCQSRAAPDHLQALENCEARYRLLADNSRDIVCLQDANCRYLYVSPSSIEVLGWHPDELVGHAPNRLLHPQDLAEIRADHEEFGCKPLASVLRQVRMRCRNGEYRWVELLVRRLESRENGPAVVVSVIRDVAARQKAEQAVRVSEAQLARAQRQAKLGNWSSDLRSGEFRCSVEACRLLGLQLRAPTTIRVVMRKFSGAERPAFRASFRQAIERGVSECELRIPATEGGRWIKSRIEIDYDAAGSPCFASGTVQDINHAKQQSEALLRSGQAFRRLAEHRDQALEKERRRLAHEIHDEFGQRLTAIRMEVAMLELNHGPQAPGLRSEIAAIKSSIDGAIRVVRSLSTSLRPAILGQGLPAAARWMLTEFSRSHRIPHKLRCSDQLVLPEAQVTVAFRILQEALTNVARHANCKHVAVAIYRRSNMLFLEVSDDGHGIDLSAAATSSGFGLLGMRERVEILGGSLEIRRRAKGGTRVRAVLPAVEAGDGHDSSTDS